jgi:hypothetical protein
MQGGKNSMPLATRSHQAQLIVTMELNPFAEWSPVSSN